MAKPMDMHKEVKPMSWYLVPVGVIGMLFTSGLFGARTKINKVNCEGLKPPFIVYSNHSSFIDFPNLLKAVFPRRLSWVCSIEEFNRSEWLMRHAGCIPKRKYTKDISLLKRIKYATNEKKRSVVIHPEARYSLCGVPDSIGEGLGKFAKYIGVPVVVFNQKGNFLRSPQWAKKPERKEIPQVADFIQVATAEDVKNLSAEELQARIAEAFVYDDFKYQADNNIKMTFKDRAKNIHKVLYKCPCCGDEENMTSYERFIECKKCNAKWEMDEYSKVHLMNEGYTWDATLSHVPNWYRWERKTVEEEVYSGKYHFEDDVRVEHLVNAHKKFVTVGTVHMTQDESGIKLEGTLDDGTPFLFEKPAASTTDVHVEFDFHNRGDAIEISDLEKTYFVYPLNKYNVLTKIHFATETLFNKVNKKD